MDSPVATDHTVTYEIFRNDEIMLIWLGAAALRWWDEAYHV